MVLWIINGFSCVSPKSLAGNQGVIGQVRWVEGNMMPTIGDTTLGVRAHGVEVQREVVFINATNATGLPLGKNGLYEKLPGKEVASVLSDEEGNFKVHLATGTYSVFTKEEGGYFANIYDGNNYINPVTVQKDIFTEIVILINYKAVY